MAVPHDIIDGAPVCYACPVGTAHTETIPQTKLSVRVSPFYWTDASKMGRPPGGDTMSIHAARQPALSIRVDKELRVNYS